MRQTTGTVFKTALAAFIVYPTLALCGAITALYLLPGCQRELNKTGTPTAETVATVAIPPTMRVTEPPPPLPTAKPPALPTRPAQPEQPAWLVPLAEHVQTTIVMLEDAGTTGAADAAEVADIGGAGNGMVLAAGTSTGCREGWAMVRVPDIPAMTDNNKDKLNKDCLFCLHDSARQNIIAVYQRYLWKQHSHYPSPCGDACAWWQTWRLEAGGVACVVESNLFTMPPLPPGEQTWGIYWLGKYVVAARLTANRQEIDGPIVEVCARNPIVVDGMLYEDEGCQVPPGYAPFPSDAHPELLAWDCWHEGRAKPCPERPTPTPDATSAPGAPGYTSGRAVITVSGATVPPDAAHDKGCIAALINGEGGWAMIKHRARNGIATWQAKGTTGNEAETACWREINYHQTTPAEDGAWTIEWADNVVTFTDPNGSLQQLNWGDTSMAWTAVIVGSCPTEHPCRGSVPFAGKAVVTEYELGEIGRQDACP